MTTIVNFMTHRRSSRQTIRQPRTQGRTLCAALVAAALLGVNAPAIADETLLISDTLDVSRVEVVEINDSSLVHLDDSNGWRTIPLDQCVGFLRPGASMRAVSKRGTLHLVDGQVIPGSILSNSEPDSDMVVWNHAWLSRVEVPLDQIAAVLMTEETPMPQPGESDVVVLANGDRYDGFIIDIGDPVSIDVDQPDGSTTTVTIPLDRVAAIGLVSQRKPAVNPRVWFTDGSVLDVRRLHVGDDGFARLESTWSSGSDEIEMPFARIAGALFSPGAIQPLAGLRVERITGPSTRYMIPAPATDDAEQTPLDLADITLHGALAATWRLPGGIRRFAAQATLPQHARVWGDFELVVSVDGDERFRARINQANPEVEVNIDTTGGLELTIELTEGKYGSIQDELVLHRAMLLAR